MGSYPILTSPATVHRGSSIIVYGSLPLCETILYVLERFCTVEIMIGCWKVC
jgi:hypothetical protein